MTICDECGYPIAACNEIALLKKKAAKLEDLLREADNVVVWETVIPQGRQFQRRVEEAFAQTVGTGVPVTSSADFRPQTAQETR